LKGQVSAVAKAMADQIAMVYQGRRGRKNLYFCETKPFVMLRKSYLCGMGRMGYVDYRKMTNGFVFGETGLFTAKTRIREASQENGWKIGA
jgi:hypothetical protein